MLDNFLSILSKSRGRCTFYNRGRLTSIDGVIQYYKWPSRRNEGKEVRFITEEPVLSYGG